MNKAEIVNKYRFVHSYDILSKIIESLDKVDDIIGFVSII